MQWFNKLLREPALQKERDNLVGKIAGRKPVGDLGCLEVPGQGKEFRPQMDKKYRENAKKVLDELPERYAHYHIGMLAGGVAMMDRDAPRVPEKWRKVLTRSGKVMDKDATWVCSHLCHNPKCSNHEHLRWEPSWMNRLRDNCAGGDACVHRPQCLRAHRDEEIIDWTEALEDEDTEL